ncbi:hypothetical protein [Arthrobacter sp. NPDC056493]|uniref:hypothetical protein n=1 Tax=Arthrobacter sp. NPDC056493 TaxID=3345839 RepID=UPI00366ECB8F
MRTLAASLVAGAVLLGATGCGKSEEWEQNKANCIKMWGDYKSAEEIEAKCTKDADYWEKNGIHKEWPEEYVADRK